MTFGPDPPAPPRLEHHYLASERDRARMRCAVRRGGDLLAAAGFALGAERGLDDRGLDAWIRAHLGTSAHLCGSARLGLADDPGAVVDPELRVHGLRGSAGGRHLGAAHRAAARTGRDGADARRARGRPHRGTRPDEGVTRLVIRCG